MKIAILIYLFFLEFLTFAQPYPAPAPESSPSKIKVIVIDPGHGGKDPGTLGKISQEKNVALAISLELGRIIKKNMPGVKVVYTRTNDKFVELYRRADIANENKADLFISIHCNAAPRRMPNRASVFGTSTYVMGLHRSEENLEVAKRENSVITKESNYQNKYNDFSTDSPQSNILLSLHQQTHLQNSLNLANKIENQFKYRVKRKSRGVKQAGFIVLYNTTMPSVLVEIGFLSNPTEEKYLNSSEGQVYLASAIFRAIREYNNSL